MLRKYWYLFLKQQNYSLGVLSCAAMKWRGYSKYPLHPKHLFDEHRSDYLHGLFREDISFLDIGSGVGTECLLAAEKKAQLAIGLEYDRKSVMTAAERCMNKDQVYFFELDLEQASFPFTNECFDLVNFSNVLEHIKNRHAVLSELKRIKKKNGLVVISVPNSETTWKKRLKAVGIDSRDDPDHKIEYSRQSLAEELRTADLHINSDMMPIIPSLPWDGIIAMSAFFSPSLYKKLQAAKRRYVQRHPDESTGWVFTAI